MPALPDVAKVLRLDQHFTVGEDTKAKVRSFWQYLTGPPTDSELATAAAAIRVAFGTDLAGFMVSPNELSEVILTDLTSSTAAQGSDSTPVAGTITSEPVPANCCVLESMQVARRYRGGHPRNYWPFGAATDMTDEQLWGATFASNVQAGLVSYNGAITTAIDVFGGTTTPVAVSYYEGFTPFTGPTGRVRNISTVRATPVVDPIVTIQVRRGIGSQRRRLLKLA
jgi:hypothetical protein